MDNGMRDIIITLLMCSVYSLAYGFLFRGKFNIKRFCMQFVVMLGVCGVLWMVYKAIAEQRVEFVPYFLIYTGLMVTIYKKRWKIKRIMKFWMGKK